MFKNAVKASGTFNAKINDFLPPFSFSKPFQKTGPPRHFFGIFPKTCPRCPKTPPRHLQDASKTLQKASKTPLRPPKTSPRRLWTAHKRLQAASSCLETPPKCYKIETCEKSLNFHSFSFKFSSFFMFSGFPRRGKGQTPLSKQFIC